MMVPARLPAMLAALLVAGCGGGGSSDGGGAAAAQPASTAGPGPADSPAPAALAAPLTKTAAARLLAQATMGATAAGIDAAAGAGADAWLMAQFGKPIGATHVDDVQAQIAAAPATATRFQYAPFVYQSFWKQAVTADDQLRQRVAFALSQIFVVSLVDSTVAGYARGVASFHDMLARDAFGNFRRLLEDVALHPMMGLYLTHLHNQGQAGRTPDENFAREVMQLFTIGLYRLGPDGTVRRDAGGRPIETYGNDDVTGLARVFTGFSWAGPDRSDARFAGRTADPDRDILPMQGYPKYHSDQAKTFLGTTCPGGTAPEQSLACALDALFNHPNVGPFVGRQLIQRLVTSNPSPAYVARVAAAFADDGAGVRGDMKAMIRAVLLDPEARDGVASAGSAAGRLKEPLLRMSAFLRAVSARSTSGAFLIGNTDDPATSLGQTAFRSPSVFNFYRPGYVPPSTDLGAASLVAPELQTTSESSVAGYVNTMQSVVQNGAGSGTPRDVQPDWTEWAALADDADALVDRMGLVLAAGALSSPARATIRDAVAAIAVPAANPAAAATARLNRVRTAAFLVLASPDFIVQK